MDSILVFIDGTICDTRLRNPLFGSREFYSEENILSDIPTMGSVECMKELSKRFSLVYIGARPAACLPATREWMQKVGFPEGEIYLGKDQQERMQIALKLKGTHRFAAGIGDRWDDNELHLVFGCMSIILKEWEPDWNTALTYIK
ncbi:MAG: hypothetical protein P4L75_00675 [Clostridia bacterium]|nr:hypothetical protein [Clostridia bacterium]MDR3645606.1 hypothetical protein [Clostridia bacterium]